MASILNPFAFCLRNKQERNNNFFRLYNNGFSYEMFSHNYNCGYPGIVRTERAVELALADYWLTQVNDPLEIGAVTPYYWPGRLTKIIDPHDSHPFVTEHSSMFEHDLRGKHVLCISTIEHIGKDDYGDIEPKRASEAVSKILSEASTSLITVPLGWNRDLDRFLLNMPPSIGYAVNFLIRKSPYVWVPTCKEKADIPYGGKPSSWANSLAIIEKGSLLV
jgi:hypothetical protein